MRIPGRLAAAIIAVGLLAGLLVGLSGRPADAQGHRRPAAAFSSCGHGHAEADSQVEPGGGGDTIVVGDGGGIYHYLFDSSSPVTLDAHDRIVFEVLAPRELRLKRVGDHLVICHDARRYELVVDSHYCRADAVTPADVPNSEIEEIAFIAAREIWLADALYDDWRTRPGSFPPVTDATYAGVSPGSWTIRPFRDVLPDMRLPARDCP